MGEGGGLRDLHDAHSRRSADSGSSGATPPCPLRSLRGQRLQHVGQVAGLPLQHLEVVLKVPQLLHRRVAGLRQMQTQPLLCIPPPILRAHSFQVILPSLIGLRALAASLPLLRAASNTGRAALSDDCVVETMYMEAGM